VQHTESCRVQLPRPKNLRGALDHRSVDAAPAKATTRGINGHSTNPTIPNWVATVAPMGSENTKRYTAKVADLRKTDLRVDWSEIESPDGTAPNSARALRANYRTR
jgi:hypothetical protein